MDLIIREKIKDDVKALASRRALSKRRARRLQNKAEKLLREYREDETVRQGPDSRLVIGMKRTQAASLLIQKFAVETRHAHLAYGLLRGVPYRVMEEKTRSAPDPEMILNFIREYSPEWTLEQVTELLK